MYLPHWVSTEGSDWQWFGPVTSNSAPIFVPGDSQVGFMADGTYRVQKTTDGGQTWQGADQGLTLKLSDLKGGILRLGRSLSASGRVTPSRFARSKVKLTVQRKVRKLITIRSVTRVSSAKGALRQSPLGLAPASAPGTPATPSSRPCVRALRQVWRARGSCPSRRACTSRCRRLLC